MIYTVKIITKENTADITFIPPSVFKPMFGANEIHYNTHILQDSCAGAEVAQKEFVWKVAGVQNLTESIPLKSGDYCLKIENSDVKIIEAGTKIVPSTFTLPFGIK
jgi:hypothetical protein